MDHRIDIEVVGIGAGGARYRVHLAGEVLLEACRVPLLDSCRALLARGVTGKLTMYSRGGDQPRLSIDIEAGAQLTVSEGNVSGPRFARWLPHPRADADTNSKLAAF